MIWVHKALQLKKISIKIYTQRMSEWRQKRKSIEHTPDGM